jgi:mRNA interferase HigB
MRIVAIRILRDFWEQHPDAEQQLKAWIDEAKVATWQNPHDIKQQYRNASVLQNRRIVFNIKGNHYRLVVACAFRFGALYIKYIGDHAAYDAIDAETVEME